MNRLHLVAPLFILVAAACWLLSQVKTARRLEAGNEEMRTSLDTRIAATPDAKPPRPSPLDSNPRDWTRIAADLQKADLIPGILPANARLLATLEEMDVAALETALDEIASADLLTADRELLEKRLAKLLIARDPETGFSRFCEPKRPNWSFFLGGLFNGWVQRDPSRAVDWLQRHIAAGGEVPGQMVNMPFFAVLRDQPALAASILTALPEERRLESLRCLSVGGLHNPAGQNEWAQIVHENLPEGDRLKAIAWPLGNWSDGDGSPMLLAEVDAYLQRIDATPEEQLACIMQVATQQRSWRDSQGEKPPFAEGLERMQAWVAGHSPDQVTEATLRALEHAARFSRFADASTVALQLHQETGDQAYLHAVLKSVRRIEQHDNVPVLLDRVTDQDRIEQYRDQIR